MGNKCVCFGIEEKDIKDHINFDTLEIIDKITTNIQNLKLQEYRLENIQKVNRTIFALKLTNGSIYIGE